MTDPTKRIVVRLDERQQTWIAEQARDEGMDSATFVRVVLDRLSKGRPPLIAMMATNWRNLGHKTDVDCESLPDVTDLSGRAVAVDDLLAARELQATPQDGPQDKITDGAIPLRRVGRERYNPGRS